MARIRVFLVLVLALTAGGALAFGTYNFMQNQAPAATKAAPTRPVVVAASDLSIGTELALDDVRVIQWPEDSVPADVFARAEDVVGRGVVVPVIQNELILPLKLADEGAGAGLPPAIPQGLRAVSVRVNEVIGVAGYVVPGTRVDVVATVSPTQNQIDVTTKVILTDVQVLAAGTKIENTDNKPVQVTVVTLLVNPDEAERLTLASTEGKIQLALRNPLDRSKPETSGVRPSVLLGSAPTARVVPSRRPGPQPAAPAPVAAVAPAPTMVEIIRGDQRAQEIVR